MFHLGGYDVGLVVVTVEGMVRAMPERLFFWLEKVAARIEAGADRVAIYIAAEEHAREDADRYNDVVEVYLLVAVIDLISRSRLCASLFVEDPGEGVADEALQVGFVLGARR